MQVDLSRGYSDPWIRRASRGKQWLPGSETALVSREDREVAIGSGNMGGLRTAASERRFSGQVRWGLKSEQAWQRMESAAPPGDHLGAAPWYQ